MTARDSAVTLTAPAAAPHRMAIFAVVSSALVMSTVDATIVSTALKAIQDGLDASITWTSWVITAYAVGLVLALALSGKLIALFGSRRCFLASVAVFAGASLACGFAGNVYLLIALRAIQAAGGAGFTPAGTSIVAATFGPARDRALGMFSAMFSIGTLIGPIFGGLFVTYWTWRGIFFINVPIGIVLVAACLRYVPADGVRAGRGERRPLDLTGLGLLGAGTLALMLGISYLGEQGASAASALLWAPLAAGAAGLALFARHIRRAADPFIEPRLIAGRGFGPVNVVNVVYGGAVSGMLVLVPLYAMDRYQISVLASGTLLIAEGIAVIALSLVATMFLRSSGYRWPLYLGGGIMAVGIAALAVVPAGVSPYAWLSVSAAAVGAGTGLSSPAGRNAGLQLAPGKAADLAALRSTGRSVGQIVAVSVTAAIIAQPAPPGQLQARVFVVFAVLLAACLPVIARIPEHRGSW